MVRNIVGTLIEVGRGNIQPDRMLVERGNTAPAKGLTLLGVEYAPRVCK
jgi:tRNA U38,U39,U40 pseudouridine synthase TruA